MADEASQKGRDDPSEAPDLACFTCYEYLYYTKTLY